MMPPMPWPELALAGLATAFGYGMFGFSGFGANIVALPVLAQLLSLRVVVPMMLLFDIVSAASIGMKQRSRVQWRELARLAPFLLLGMFIGVTALARADERVLLTLLGAFVVANALWNLFGHPRVAPISPHWSAPAGLAGGVFTALYGTGGPIYTLYLARRIADTALLRASIGALIFGGASVRLVLFTGSGLYAQPQVLRLGMWLAPCALLGYLVGSRLHDRADPAWVRRVIWGLLLFGGAGLIARGLFGATR